MAGDEFAERLREGFEALGLSEAEARVAAYGRDGVPADPFDRAVELGRRLGLNEAGARAFAVGRDGSESEARRGFAEPAGPSRATVRGAMDEAVVAAQRIHGIDERGAREWVAYRLRQDGVGSGEPLVSWLRRYAGAARGASPQVLNESAELTESAGQGRRRVVLDEAGGAVVSLAPDGPVGRLMAGGMPFAAAVEQVHGGKRHGQQA